MPSAIDQCLHAGTVFEGRYEILAELGAGTFGRVYKARQLSTGQEVAVKVLRLERTAGPEGASHVERFRREMRLCVELAHPNIVRLLDSGETEDGTLYAVFEFVPGSTLKDLISVTGKLELREAIHLMGQVLDALSCAHARGVVHRDLKPENIMVMNTGVRRNAMVLDFGLGGLAPDASGWGLPRITRTQEMMGTPCYAAPEQLRGEPPTTRSDLYSWGLILLECLTGELAVSGASVHEAILKQIGDEPIVIPPEIASEPLRRLLEAVCAKRVEQRDVTIEALLRTLGSVESGEPARALDATTAKPAPGERRQVTVLSCRLGVARADGGGVDLEELDEVIHAQHALYAELAARGAGQVANGFGNQSLLVFGYQQAHEDDARRAARIALSITAETSRRNAQLNSERGIQLAVHIGIHTGLVIAHELLRPTRETSLDLVGLTPQVALRLSEMAGASEVLASTDTVRLLRTEIEHEPIGERGVPELGGNIAVCRLTRVRPSAAGVETIHSQRETHLVGRTQQLEQLLAALERAQEGRGAVSLITGEPGIGKSRLVRELRRRWPADTWLACQCVAENQDSPLRPFIDLLSAYEEPIEALLTRHGMDLTEYMPLFATLLSLPPDERYPATPLTPDRQKELTLNAILTLILRMASERPLVLAIEDLHWADPTTLDLITLLVDEVRGLDVAAPGDDVPRLCIVMTARPQFVPTWSIDRVSLIALSRLASEEIESMVAANFAADPAALPRKVLDEVIVRSDGVPLFVEEVSRVLLGSEPGQPTHLAAAEVEIPGSLRDLLAARLDAVSASAKETAQLASVLGREFRYEVIRAVSHKAESLVRADMRELINAGLIYQRRSARAERYLFKHALLRDSAYESMMRSTRQQLHERVANILRERFPEIERTQPEVLARHFADGGHPDSAAECWGEAGALALDHGTYVESIRHFEQGLDLVRNLPPTLNTRRLEATLTEPLGTALVATQGYASAEVEKTFRRAMTLCQELGEDVSFRVLYGIWGVHFVRSERETTAFLLERLRLHAQRTGEAIAVCTAESAAGLRAFFDGDFERARDELTKATRWYGDESILEEVRRMGYDGRLYPFAYLTCALAILGQAELAEQMRDRMLGLAEESPNPYARGIALMFALNLAHDTGDVDAASRFGAQATAHANEQKLPYFLATALPVCGWALVSQGQTAAGVEQIQYGLNLLNVIGIRSFYAYYLSMLAEAHLVQGSTDDGLKAVDEGLDLGQQLLDRFYAAELHRLKGELLLARGDPSAAEASLRCAHDLARRQNARLFLLRTALSLGCLLRDQGRKDDARAVLADVYPQCTDGLVPADVRRAEALFAEL